MSPSVPKRLSSAAPAPLQRIKLDSIEWAFARVGVRSFADLGGVWRVAAGYTRFAAQLPGVNRAVLVDTGIPDRFSPRTKGPQLELVKAEFGSPAAVDTVGSVDAILLFDVLLHQVNPDWDEIIALYASRTKSFVVVQPQWREGAEAVRLLELGRDEYLRRVPKEQISIDFQRLDDEHPVYNRPWRDIHEIWQWGIPDGAMIDAMSKHGFRLVRYVDQGQWGSLPSFSQVSFVFVSAEVQP